MHSSCIQRTKLASMAGTAPHRTATRTCRSLEIRTSVTLAIAEAAESRPLRRSGQMAFCSTYMLTRFVSTETVASAARCTHDHAHELQAGQENGLRYVVMTKLQAKGTFALSYRNKLPISRSNCFDTRATRRGSACMTSCSSHNSEVDDDWRMQVR